MSQKNYEKVTKPLKGKYKAPVKLRFGEGEEFNRLYEESGKPIIIKKNETHNSYRNR